MNRPIFVLLCLLLIAAIALATHFVSHPESGSNQPVVYHVKVEVPVTDPKPTPTSSTQPPLTSQPVENSAFALVGKSKAELITKMGSPRSQIEASGVQILRYNDYIIKLKEGLVQSVDVAPKETHSDTRVRVQTMPQQQVRYSTPVAVVQEPTQMGEQSWQRR